ncbi:MAG: hypothetical protein DRI57_04775 [Deltaproteobacteria bacterium]|nr:MAG: hypothetical protein DRI57_04775 [Deltaproteobacteria bacterium]
MAFRSSAFPRLAGLFDLLIIGGFRNTNTHRNSIPEMTEKSGPVRSSAFRRLTRAESCAPDPDFKS